MEKMSTKRRDTSLLVIADKRKESIVCKRSWKHLSLFRIWYQIKKIKNTTSFSSNNLKGALGFLQQSLVLLLDLISFFLKCVGSRFLTGNLSFEYTNAQLVFRIGQRLKYAGLFLFPIFYLLKNNHVQFKSRSNEIHLLSRASCNTFCSEDSERVCVRFIFNAKMAFDRDQSLNYFII